MGMVFKDGSIPSPTTITNLNQLNMSVKKFIRENMPEEWRVPATELRMKNELVERLYGVIPHQYKNKYHYKEAIIMLRRIFRANCSIIHLIDATDINLTKWLELNNKINEYRERCM